MSLEQYFAPFRDNIIGHNHQYPENNNQKIIYADWIASGRLYQPVEDYITGQLGPYVANTHTETTLTGTTMTHAYHEAQKVIKDHVNANSDDVLIAAGSGMTLVINKFQRMLGLRIPEKWRDRVTINDHEKPLVLITHMEHHSNQTTWHECEVTVEIIKSCEKGCPDLEHMQELLEQYKDRPIKIGSFTACSNVTGIKTPYHKMAEIMHQHGGLCFIDFAASAPYVDIDMHPQNPAQKLDAIFISPHKFLGGPGSSGILVFDKHLYDCEVPDQPGGGTVSWTNPWGEHKFFDDIEAREDGGTPAFLQTIRAALAIKVKEQMGVKNIVAREKELCDFLMTELSTVPGLNILEADKTDRLCVISFYVLGLHHNLIVRLLNDRFGVQTRGGCSCAGTYGHILLDVDQITSLEITKRIDQGDLTDKPGWVRISMHPTSTDADAQAVVDAVKAVVENAEEWSKDYQFDSCCGEFKTVATTRYKTVNDFQALPQKPSKLARLLNFS
ncbi:aminotransferase class V-fold PLP-dependent enzyme [Kangiella sp. HZ709]|uniref:aminotransferase class V-fold PLP-dependent enzyme n=1 Tax=Kangiella sp. HZ709 TaxID=2666328 RepID=UPI0012AF36AB|nr:aminotransferase class V-fold PLP-dependent enzyme [Kangiella sp. HZ709]MRX27980.1 aminotransferase class V-fold PLP-dependent enzyme [Kangiella sp. HZ709]